MAEIQSYRPVWEEFAKDCAAQGRQVVDIESALFGKAAPSALLWHRVLHLKRATLKMILSRVLQEQGQQHQQLVLPDELSPMQLKLPALRAWQTYHVCLPQALEGGPEFMQEFLDVLKTLDGQVIRRRSFKGFQKQDSALPVGALHSSLQIGVCGDDSGCTLANSSNMLLPLSNHALSNKALMDEVRRAIRSGINVVTVHNKDDGEEFDDFISVCPDDLKRGAFVHALHRLKSFVDDEPDERGTRRARRRAKRSGQRTEVRELPGLFDNLAVDWFSPRQELGYRQTCAMLVLRQLRTANTHPFDHEERGASAVVEMNQLQSSLGALSSDEGTKTGATPAAVSVIEVADI